jgi:hypothetical protein
MPPELTMTIYPLEFQSDSYYPVSEEEIISALRVLVELEGAKVLDPDLVDYTALKVQRQRRADEKWARAQVPRASDAWRRAPGLFGQQQMARAWPTSVVEQGPNFVRTVATSRASWASAKVWGRSRRMRQSRYRTG